MPIVRAYSYEETRRFSEVVAGALVRAAPRLVTTERVRARGRGVFVDTKMNGEGMTIVSPYSVRPRPGAPVATPLRWEDSTSGSTRRRSRLASCSSASIATAISSSWCCVAASGSNGRFGGSPEAGRMVRVGKA